jgi:hypothetical protein
MVHETWIALYKGAPLKERLMGWLQRRGFRRYLRCYAPKLLHTSNPSYVTALGREGYPATVLPLFGNIRIHPSTTPHKPDAPLSALLFGTLHSQWDPNPTAEWLQRCAAQQGRQARVVAAGRLGPHAPQLLGALRTKGLVVEERGELPADQVSHLMQDSDLGIVPHPWALIGKSGVAAAMLEHGLPVMVPRNDWHLLHGKPEAMETDPLLLRLEDATPERSLKWLTTRRPPEAGLPRVASLLLTQMEKIGLPN